VVAGFTNHLNSREGFLPPRQVSRILPNLSIPFKHLTLKKVKLILFLSMIMVSQRACVDKVLISLGDKLYNYEDKLGIT